MRSTGYVVDELRRCINRMCAQATDPVVQSYLDASFLALEDAPTENRYLGADEAAESSAVEELTHAYDLLGELAADGSVDQGALIACRSGLHRAAEQWTERVCWPGLA